MSKDITRDEAQAWAVKIWGDRAYAFDALGKAPLIVGCAGVARATGPTFREALLNAGHIIDFEARRILNRREAVGLVSSVPSGLNEAGWGLAVLALLEHCNAREVPMPLSGCAGYVAEILQIFEKARELYGKKVLEGAGEPRVGGFAVPIGYGLDLEFDGIVMKAYVRGLAVPVRVVA